MNCPNCGATVPEGSDRCLKCNTTIEQQPQQAAPQGAPQQAAPAAQQQEVNVVVAAILTWFFQGVGHLYIGQVGKGILFLVLWLILSAADVLTCGLAMIIHLPVAIVLLIDVVQVSKRINRGEKVSPWRFF